MQDIRYTWGVWYVCVCVCVRAARAYTARGELVPPPPLPLFRYGCPLVLTFWQQQGSHTESACIAHRECPCSILAERAYKRRTQRLLVQYLGRASMEAKHTNRRGGVYGAASCFYRSPGGLTRQRNASTRDGVLGRCACERAAASGLTPARDSFGRNGGGVLERPKSTRLAALCPSRVHRVRAIKPTALLAPFARLRLTCLPASAWAPLQPSLSPRVACLLRKSSVAPYATHCFRLP